MVLGAHEDKTYRGAYVASPPCRGRGAPAWRRLRAPTTSCGRAPHWTNTQLDEVADPIILAWQLGRTDAGTYAHVKRAADYVVANGPRTPQERWENQDGWSPATIAAEIAGLVCAADLAARNGDTASANAFLEIADKWQKSVPGVDRDDDRPVLVRSVLPAPDQGRAARPGHDVLDRRQRPLGHRPAPGGRPELPRARAPWRQAATGSGHRQHNPGRRRATRRYHTDRHVLASLRIRRLRREARRLAVGRQPARHVPDHRAHLADLRRRAWRIRAGGRVIGVGAPDRAGSPRFPPGEGTLSATPLAWSHAQFVRLAWSIDAGRPVERPAVVACRYTGTDC
jgi:glucoamylase